MVDLERITVEGFKGVDHLEADVRSLNIITGRNNSGKTSFLEVIDLVYQPTHIANFGPDLDTIIHTHHDQCRISVDLRDGNREYQIYTPGTNQVPDILLSGFRKILYSISESLAPDEMDEEDVIEVIDGRLPELVSEAVSRDYLEEAAHETLIFEIGQDTYPYMYFGPHIADVFYEVRNELEDIIRDTHVESSNDWTGKQMALTDLAVDFRHTRISLPESGMFVEEEPPQLGSANYVDFIKLSESLDFDADESDPVKIDDIGDFIRENELVDNLKTFDTDYLIFEDDSGGKYSVPFQFMGDGFKVMVGVLWELFDEDDLADIVLLEEPETHMHPGYVRELTYFLIEFARDHDIQMFITTQNNDFLNDFFTDNLTDDELAFLRKSFALLQLQDGAADVMGYSEAEEQLKDLQLDLRGI